MVAVSGGKDSWAMLELLRAYRRRIPFDFDYDGNTQGGRTPSTDAAVTVVAIGEDDAQYVVAEAVITRASGQNIALVAPQERNYANP